MLNMFIPRNLGKWRNLNLNEDIYVVFCILGAYVNNLDEQVKCRILWSSKCQSIWKYDRP